MTRLTQGHSAEVKIPAFVYLICFCQKLALRVQIVPHGRPSVLGLYVEKAHHPCSDEGRYMNHLWRGKIFTICGPVLGGRTLVGLTYAVGLMSYFRLRG